MRATLRPILCCCFLSGRALLAQSATLAPSPVLSMGAGPETYVLISSVLGGVDGMRRLANRFVADGARVLVIDPFALSADSSDLSFHALAQRIDAILSSSTATRTHVLGHAFGAGVALRLAANYPDRVADLTLLDAGAYASYQSANMARSLRIARLLVHLPGGSALVRHYLHNALAEHSGKHEWLDAATERAYVDPIADHLDRVTAIMGRLCGSREPDAIEEVVRAVRVPVTLVLGGFPHSSAPDSLDLAPLDALGPQLRVERLAGVGFFPHEEVPDAVAQIVLGTRVVAAHADTRR